MIVSVYMIMCVCVCVYAHVFTRMCVRPPDRDTGEVGALVDFCWRIFKAHPAEMTFTPSQSPSAPQSAAVVGMEKPFLSSNSRFETEPPPIVLPPVHVSECVDRQALFCGRCPRYSVFPADPGWLRPLCVGVCCRGGNSTAKFLLTSRLVLPPLLTLLRLE